MRRRNGTVLLKPGRFSAKRRVGEREIARDRDEDRTQERQPHRPKSSDDGSCDRDEHRQRVGVRIDRPQNRGSNDACDSCKHRAEYPRQLRGPRVVDPAHRCEIVAVGHRAHAQPRVRGAEEDVERPDAEDRGDEDDDLVGSDDDPAEQAVHLAGLRSQTGRELHVGSRGYRPPEFGDPAPEQERAQRR